MVSQPLSSAKVSKNRLPVYLCLLEPHVNSFLACKIRYYHNYYTQDSTRHYYSSEVPVSIQIKDHAFIEAELCELFTSFMLFAWVSSQNCANILNASITRCSIELGLDDLSISSEQVFCAFTFNVLMCDCSESGNALSLPDLGDHDARLKCAMELRNKKMISVGQKEKMHACTKCEKFIDGKGYKNLSKSFRSPIITATAQFNFRIIACSCH